MSYTGEIFKVHLNTADLQQDIICHWYNDTALVSHRMIVIVIVFVCYVYWSSMNSEQQNM